VLGLALAGAIALSPGSRPAGSAWTLRIPAIRVDARIVPTGINKDGTVGVPSLTQVRDVGWYRYGAVPGAPGPAVLLGHVDTYAGPSVFYRLYLLRHGDTVDVRMGRRSAEFTVTSLRQVSKRDFPAGVYAPGGPPVLYLVTCAGAFDYATRHYADNIIITARPREHHDRQHLTDDPGRHARPGTGAGHRHQAAVQPGWQGHRASIDAILREKGLAEPQ
jgi:hypothetical protein